MRKLIVDCEAYLHPTKQFFFQPGFVRTILDYSTKGYGVYLLNLKSDKSVEASQINWIKNFFIAEDVKINFISEEKNFQKLLLNKNFKQEHILVCLQRKVSTFVKYFDSTDKSIIIYSLKAKSSKKASISINRQPHLMPMNNWKEVGALLLPKKKERVAIIVRKTSETDIKLRLNLDGSGKAQVKTGLGFFDHMLTNFTKHSGIDIDLTVKGDLEVDEHHTIEDTAIVLGQAFNKALGDKKGISRYGFVLPMDESEVACSIDFSGRSFLVWKQKPFKREYVGDFPTEMIKHFYQSFAVAAELNLNMKITGENEHHMIEASFKSLAKSIKQAVSITGNEIPSTKGSL